MFLRLGLFMSVSLSILIHLILLIYIPVLELPQQEPIIFTEIELRELPKSLPEAKEVLASSSYDQALEEEKIAGFSEDLPEMTEFMKRAEEVVLEKLPPDLVFLKKPGKDEVTLKVDEPSLSTFRERPAPSLDIPKTQLEIKDEEIFVRFSKSLMTETVPYRIGQNPFPTEYLDKHMPSNLSMIMASKKDNLLKPAFNLLEKEEPVPVISKARKDLQEKKEDMGEGTAKIMEIKGPVAKRAIIYRPPIPKVRVETSIDIQLKFWVLADGSVGRVIPIVKGDSRLESEAIKYLKQWKFAPLSSGDNQEDQWGTIPIKFLLG